MTPGWFFLAASVVAYGVANFLQALAAARVTEHRELSPSLLLRLVSYKSYLLGLVGQVVAFVFAFLARRDLPLFLVQASVAAGLGVTALLGVVVLRWRLPRAEVILLTILAGGLGALIVSAERSPSKELGGPAAVVLAVLVIVLALLGRPAARLRGAPGSVALGGLSGIAFGAAAIVSRPLANVESAEEFVSTPLLYLLLAHALVGQLLLGLAMQRRSTTAAVAAMDAAAAVPASVVGLALLGDRIEPGLEWLAALGFIVTLGAVIGLARYAEPQDHAIDERLQRFGLRELARH